MIHLTDVAPDVTVLPAEYQRLLGYPNGRVLEGRALELADDARQWYARHGKPWIFARESRDFHVTATSIVIDGSSFTSPRLRSMLLNANAERVVLVAVSAGPELEAEAQRRWTEEKPDEYFFLEMYGAAVVEHLVAAAGARLCAAAEQLGLAVLPHYSPGYPGWDITQQHGLLHLLAGPHAVPLPGRLSALGSGMLNPKKSLLAVFGLTGDVTRVRTLAELVPCTECSLPRCQYRRRRFRRSLAGAEVPA